MGNIFQSCKKLLGSDLDGTLTKHKSPLEETIHRVLEKLAELYRLIMIAAAQALYLKPDAECEFIYWIKHDNPVTTTVTGVPLKEFWKGSEL